jgi:hypothetical protein
LNPFCPSKHWSLKARLVWTRGSSSGLGQWECVRCRSSSWGGCWPRYSWWGVAVATYNLVPHLRAHLCQDKLSPLHLAAFYGHVPCANALITAGANLLAKNKACLCVSQTPRRKHPFVVEWKNCLRARQTVGVS